MLFAVTWLESTLAGFLPTALKPLAPWLEVLLVCLAVLGALLNAVAIGIYMFLIILVVATIQLVVLRRREVNL